MEGCPNHNRKPSIHCTALLIDESGWQWSYLKIARIQVNRFTTYHHERRAVGFVSFSAVPPKTKKRVIG